MVRSIEIGIASGKSAQGIYSSAPIREGERREQWHQKEKPAAKDEDEEPKRGKQKSKKQEHHTKNGGGGLINGSII